MWQVTNQSVKVPGPLLLRDLPNSSASFFVGTDHRCRVYGIYPLDNYQGHYLVHLTLILHKKPRDLDDLLDYLQDLI